MSRVSYRVNQEVRSTHNQDGAIVLHIGQGQMFRLNPVGSRILELLKNGSTESAVADRVIVDQMSVASDPSIVDQICVIADQISREFDAPTDLVERDVREFLIALKNCHLVDGIEPTSNQ